jgi:2,4-dienoyl-CoA reductase-like NADH-dependent reductase (Old Yellow Enzyme family)
MSHLFEPLQLRDVTLKSRIGIPPMCQYSAQDGMAGDWHFVHYGSRAVGGAALMILEATAVTPTGRISAGDLGLWKDEQIEPLARIARFAQAQGCVPTIQLAHAGRKASVGLGWDLRRSRLVMRISRRTNSPWLTLPRSSASLSPRQSAPWRLAFRRSRSMPRTVIWCINSSRPWRTSVPMPMVAVLTIVHGWCVTSLQRCGRSGRIDCRC